MVDDFFKLKDKTIFIKIDYIGAIFIREITFQEAATFWEPHKCFVPCYKMADWSRSIYILPTNVYHHLLVVPGIRDKHAPSLRSFSSTGGGRQENK